MAELHNKADASGLYKNVTLNESAETSVQLSALGIVKTADKYVWVEDTLTYTIVVRNLDEAPGTPVEEVEVLDTIDPRIATLVSGSVKINGRPAVVPDDYTFDFVTGELIVYLGSIAPAEYHTIVFEVERV